MSDPCIDIRDLTKSFGKKQVLKGVNLSVERGSIFGFLGLNGAGKSTTIQILLGLLRPTSGECRVNGVDPLAEPVRVRQRVGYMAENQTMYGWMRVAEIIDWCGKFYPTWNPELAVKLRQQLSLPAEDKVGALSKGQSSKLALLLALAHEPGLVILDDPVLGLDPLARRDFLREVMGQLQARNVTVFFSSHLLYEIEPICDAVAILHEGRIVASGPVDELRGRVKQVELRVSDPAGLKSVPGLLDVRRSGERWSVVAQDFERSAGSLQQIPQNGMTASDLNLDEIFEAYVAGRTEVAA